MEFLAKLVEPTTLVAGALATLVVVAWLSRHRLSFFLAGATLLAYFVLSTPIGANFWLGLLEDRVASPSACEPMAADAIVIVLAGGMAGTAVESDATRLSESSLRRAMAAAQVARRSPTARFILSGGGRKPVREADLMRTLMTDHGVGPDRLVLERESLNTWENATKSAQILGERGWKTRPLYLLTSATHLPRAVATFRKAGIEACPIAADRRREPLEWESAWLPNPQALLNSFLALHEVIGLVAYRAMDRI
jgi:uncharacterized SAM-binding protein YcdF (DUF218 family)